MKKKKARTTKKARTRKPQPEITPQQRRFIEEYLVTLNATKAALAAGYGKAGAHSRGSNLLKKPAIRKAVDDAITERSKRTEISQDMVLRELYWLCKANIDDYDAAGRTKSGVPQEAMRAIAGIKRRILQSGDEAKLVSIDIRICDKVRALSLAMRHLGMLNDRLTLDVESELKKVITDAAGEFDSRIAGVVTRVQQEAAAGGAVGK